MSSHQESTSSAPNEFELSRVRSQYKNVELVEPTGTAEMASNPQSQREVRSPKPRGLWEWGTRAECPMPMPIKRERSSSPNDVPWENRETLERFDSSTFVPHFARYLVEAALCFYTGDHAGINCQTCLPPPCHLIIACNTPRCWQCWAIDSWHSLKLLIIFSHKPLSDLSTSLYCLWREKSSILRFQDYALRGKLGVTLMGALDCLCTHTHRQGTGFQIVKQSRRVTILLPARNGRSKLIRQNKINPNFNHSVTEVIFNLSLL